MVCLQNTNVFLRLGKTLMLFPRLFLGIGYSLGYSLGKLLPFYPHFPLAKLSGQNMECDNEKLSERSLRLSIRLLFCYNCDSKAIICYNFQGLFWKLNTLLS